MNPVAMKITGWNEADALGKNLKEIYNINKEGSEASIEDPVKK